MRRVAALRLPYLVVCVSFGCQAEDAPLGTSVARDSSGVHIVENVAPSWISPWRVDHNPILTIGSVEGDPEHELDRITGAVRLANGTLVIANSGRLELLFYDENGHLLRRTGSRGQGPGEFESLEWIAQFASDSVLVFDAVNQRVSYLDAEGRLGRSVRLVSSSEVPFPRPLGFFVDERDRRSVEDFVDGSLLATQGIYRLGGEPPIRAERPDQPLFRVAADGQSATVLGSFPGAEYVIVATGPRQAYERRGRPFGHKTAFAAASDRFYVADNESYEIRVYSSEGRLHSIIRLDQEPLDLTEEHFSAFKDSTIAAQVDDFGRFQMRELFRHMPPLREHLPAFAANIAVDAEQNLWVQQYPSAHDNAADWNVFGNDGRLLGTVRLPRGVDVLSIGTDYIIGLRRDEWHVEYVELFGLHKGNEPG